jgi:hypothetical protein
MHDDPLNQEPYALWLVEKLQVRRLWIQLAQMRPLPTDQIVRVLTDVLRCTPPAGLESLYARLVALFQETAATSRDADAATWARSRR